MYVLCLGMSSCFFFFKQKTAYEMRISDWSSDVCSSDLAAPLSAGKIVPDLLLRQTLEGHRRADQTAALRPVRCDEHDAAIDPMAPAGEIGRASCRERVCQYV